MASARGREKGASSGMLFLRGGPRKIVAGPVSSSVSRGERDILLLEK